MHPLRHPRNAAIVGIAFIVVGAVFWAAPVLSGGHLDYAGLTLLVVLGISMAIMSYVLIAGSPRD